MIIKIDHREHDVIQQIKYYMEIIPLFKGIEIVVENLPLGDIILSDSSKDLLIIERKTINDLKASIRDGRYEEQSYRLNGLNHPNHNIIYLIEGDINKTSHVNRFISNADKDKADKFTFYSSLFSLNYYKGFSVMRTFTLDETCLFVCNTANKLRKGELEKRLPFYQMHAIVNETKTNAPANENNENKNNSVVPTDTSEKEKEYVEVVKKVKKENITPDNIGEILLSQIPGISTITSLAIITHFKTFKNFMKEIVVDENCLKEVRYTTEKGQTKKLNKTCIQNICKFLLKMDII